MEFLPIALFAASAVFAALYYSRVRATYAELGTSDSVAVSHRLSRSTWIAAWSALPGAVGALLAASGAPEAVRLALFFFVLVALFAATGSIHQAARSAGISDQRKRLSPTP